MIQYDIIIRPLITEKTSIQKEDHNQVSFEVRKDIQCKGGRCPHDAG